jgi:hypothetical protein
MRGLEPLTLTLPVTTVGSQPIACICRYVQVF